MADVGTVTVAETLWDTVKKVMFTWTSSSLGAADKQSTTPVTGGVLRVVQVPNGGGTQPTDQYDVTVLDDDGTDVLTALGANISNAAVSVKTDKDGLGAVQGSKLYLHVTNAGNAKGGKTIVYLR
jgi:hypothetical protein